MAHRCSLSFGEEVKENPCVGEILERGGGRKLPCIGRFFFGNGRFCALSEPFRLGQNDDHFRTLWAVSKHMFFINILAVWGIYSLIKKGTDLFLSRSKKGTDKIGFLGVGWWGVGFLGQSGGGSWGVGFQCSVFSFQFLVEWGRRGVQKTTCAAGPPAANRFCQARWSAATYMRASYPLTFTSVMADILGIACARYCADLS